MRAGEKMKNLSWCVLAVAALLWNPLSARGHHGWAAFSPDTQITLKGVVTEFHFVNPHSVVEFDVKDEKGAVQSWEGEMSSPANLAPRGWTVTSLEIREEITITGYPAKNGAHALRVTRIILASGKELRLGGGN
jgi:uncharacterized protein DUF6152